MSSDQGTIIAKRGASLSKTYLVIGVFLALLAVLVSGASSLLGGLSVTGVPASTTGPGGLNLTTALPLVSVALQVFAAILFSTPVLLLYVYDKNNGVLEYFLSLGMSQGDIYRQYLKAALILSSGLVGLDVVIDIAAGLIERASWLLLLEVSGLVVAIALPAVSFATLIMMSFSSLQKQRVGSNQPLGMAIGVFTVLPAYAVPFVAPSLALETDLLLAGLIAGISLLLYLSSSRLISREKLLP
ncbi:MAG: hypothetical protein OK455_03110 [Thaumarchaeota archaeon]|nr:hypothetical protein [Nitrososphaerota archaeon]